MNINKNILNQHFVKIISTNLLEVVRQNSIFFIKIQALTNKTISFALQQAILILIFEFFRYKNRNKDIISYLLF